MFNFHFQVKQNESERTIPILLDIRFFVFLT